MRWFMKKKKINCDSFPVVADDSVESNDIEYYGIEVKHSDSDEWYSWRKLYSGKTQAEDAMQDIVKGNQRLVREGSKWRVFKLKRE